MSTPSHRRWRWPARAAVALTVLGVAGWQVRVHTAAWDGLKDGRAALARDDPAAARPALERCLAAWPQHAEAHFLAARAARKCGDPAGAERHLAQAERLGRPAADVALERALLAAQAGRRAEAGPELVRAVADGHPDAPEALAVLVPALLAEFRVPEAGDLTARWVALAPDSARAWEHRADVLERLRNKEAAVAALRRLVELDPSSRRARFALARMLLEVRQAPDEAAGHLEWLTATDPSDAAALVQLAAAREAQGRADEAAAVLDRVLAARPDARALHYRGRLELNRGRPGAAAPFLRRAADLDPSDVELLYSLFVCLQQVGTPAEARAAEERWRRCDADLKRVAELARAVGAAPDDPDLRQAIGELFLRNGREAEGLRWLESALRVRPDHTPTRRALADHAARQSRPPAPGP